MSVKRKGRILTDKERKKISDSHRGLHKGKKNIMYGEKHSKETKEKISNTKRLKRSKNNIKIVCVETGYIFNSLREVALFYDVSHTSISKYCRNGKIFKKLGLRFNFYNRKREK